MGCRSCSRCIRRAFLRLLALPKVLFTVLNRVDISSHSILTAAHGVLRGRQSAHPASAAWEEYTLGISLTRDLVISHRRCTATNYGNASEPGDSGPQGERQLRLHVLNEELQAAYSSGVQQRRPQPPSGDLYVPRDVARCFQQPRWQ